MKSWLREYAVPICFGVFCVLVAALLISWRWGVQSFLALHTGTDYCVPSSVPAQYLPVCRYYGFWSGFGSDLGEYLIVVGLFGNIMVLWRAHTCHWNFFCWRAPHHPLEGTPYRLCHKHHPDNPPSHKSEVQQAVADYVEANADGN